MKMASTLEVAHLLSEHVSSGSDSSQGRKMLEMAPSTENGLCKPFPSHPRAVLSGELLFNDKERVFLRLLETGFEWGDGMHSGRKGGQARRVDLTEVVAVTLELPSKGSCVGNRRLQRLCIHSFQRNKKRSALWKPVKYSFAASQAEVIQMWVEKTQEYLRKLPDRPKRLWVFINPFGGSKRALKTWKRKVCPLFELAGIESEVHITRGANEAFACVRSVTATKLGGFDGIVVVGGDGLFQEVMNGLIERPDWPEQSMRIGHVPAGSTDAVAWSINGTRCPVSAALRIVVGDRLPLDVMQVKPDLEKGRKYSACIAGYGFMGDIISISEGLRWCGPVRYNIAGLVAFLTHHSHRARVSFVQAQSLEGTHRECTAHCELCQGELREDSASTDTGEASVEVLEGEFVSTMIAVIPCRSDKSPHGLIPYAHLSDGRIHLALVKKCPRRQYLSFLISLAKHGVIPGKHDFVQTVDAKWVRVEPMNGKSSWSIDGELLEEQNLSLNVHRGMVEVFSRGVEV